MVPSMFLRKRSSIHRGRVAVEAAEHVGPLVGDQRVEDLGSVAPTFLLHLQLQRCEGAEDRLVLATRWRGPDLAERAWQQVTPGVEGSEQLSANVARSVPSGTTTS